MTRASYLIYHIYCVMFCVINTSIVSIEKRTVWWRNISDNDATNSSSLYLIFVDHEWFTTLTAFQLLDSYSWIHFVKCDQLHARQSIKLINGGFRWTSTAEKYQKAEAIGWLVGKGREMREILNASLPTNSKFLLRYLKNGPEFRETGIMVWYRTLSFINS